MPDKPKTFLPLFVGVMCLAQMCSTQLMSATDGVFADIDTQ